MADGASVSKLTDAVAKLSHAANRRLEEHSNLHAALKLVRAGVYDQSSHTTHVVVLTDGRVGDEFVQPDLEAQTAIRNEVTAHPMWASVARYAVHPSNADLSDTGMDAILARSSTAQRLLRGSLATAFRPLEENIRKDLMRCAV